MINFGDVLGRAWKIIWKYKVLWIFGLLASLGGGGGGGSGSGSNFNFRSNGNITPNNPFPNVQRFFENLPTWVWILVVLGFLALVVILIVLSTLGRTGLVRGAWLGDGDEPSLGFRRLFSEGSSYFWRVLLLELLIFAITISLFILIAIPTGLATALTFGLALVCLLPLVCLMIPVFLLLNVVVELAVIAIVGENRGVMDGLSRGWEVFRAHLAEVIVMALILAVGGAVVGFLISLPALLILAPFIAGFVMHSNSAIAGGMVISLILFIIYLPILLALRSVLTAYVSTAWTLTFRRLTGRAAGAEVVEVLSSPSSPLTSEPV